MDVAQQLALQYSGLAGMGTPAYTPPAWTAQSSRRFSISADGVPKLTIYDFGNGGTKTTLTGPAALVNADDYYSKSLRDVYGLTASDFDTHKFYGENDTRDSTYSKIGKKLYDIAESDKTTLLGRLFNTGPVAGSAFSAGLGWTAGKIADKILGEGAIPKSTIGLLTGGVLGGIIGHIRGTKDTYYDFGKSASVMEKKGVAFQNPRNFILERLQGATDLTPIQKAQLASRIRVMNEMEAERLKSQIRAAAGFGVGALIAKFFGASMMGSIAAGVVGAMVRSVMGNAAPKKQSMLWSGPNFF